MGSRGGRSSSGGGSHGTNLAWQIRWSIRWNTRSKVWVAGRKVLRESGRQTSVAWSGIRDGEVGGRGG